MAVCTENPIRVHRVTESSQAGRMFGLLFFVLAIFVSCFRSKCRLEAENAVLRHQLMVLRSKMQGWVFLTNCSPPAPLIQIKGLSEGKISGSS